MTAPLYAHGKLMISAEYMVLFGAQALALPLRLGQSLSRCRSVNPFVFSWKAYYKERQWFAAVIDPGELKVISTDSPGRAENLCRMLRACTELMPSFREDLVKWDAETRLEFSPEWGLGSSSTLTALLSEWAEVNPLDLHFRTSEGSGYDVACAVARGPIHYRLRDSTPHYQHVEFHPPFADHLYFAWLGTKQPTAGHLRDLAGRIEPDYGIIHQFSMLTEAMTRSQELGEFQTLMAEHEKLLSGLLGIEPVSRSRFPDLQGTVKSLGAWGGDFVMIATTLPDRELFDYLYSHGIEVIFRYKELVYEEKIL